MKDIVIQGGEEKNKIVVEKQVKKNLKLLGRSRLKPGCKLYSCNPENGDVVEVEFEENMIDIDGNKKHKLKMKEGFFYIQAINEKNAVRKSKNVLKKYT